MAAIFPVIRKLADDLETLREINDEIQELVSTGRLPVMKVFSDLDHHVQDMTTAEVT